MNQRDATLGDVLENYKIIKSKRQPPHLRRILTKAKFEDDTTSAKVTRCNRPNCGLFNYLIEGEGLSLKCGKKVTIKENTSSDVKM